MKLNSEVRMLLEQGAPAGITFALLNKMFFLKKSFHNFLKPSAILIPKCRLACTKYHFIFFGGGSCFIDAELPSTPELQEFTPDVVS